MASVITTTGVTQPLWCPLHWPCRGDSVMPITSFMSCPSHQSCGGHDITHVVGCDRHTAHVVPITFSMSCPPHCPCRYQSSHGHHVTRLPRHTVSTSHGCHSSTSLTSFYRRVPLVTCLSNISKPCCLYILQTGFSKNTKRILDETKNGPEKLITKGLHGLCG